MSGTVASQLVPSLQTVFSVTHHNTVYMYLLFAAAAVSATISAVAWRRRSIGHVATAIALFMAASSWWGLAYALHWSGFFQSAGYFWLDASYLGVVVVPSAYFVFTLFYTDNSRRLTRRFKYLLVVEPVATLVILFTDRYHGLFFAGKRFEEGRAILDGGVWFWINITYSYLMILVAFVLLIRFAAKTRDFQRKQIALIVLGALIPWISSGVSLLDISPVPDLDLTPFAFTITGAAFAWALFRFNLLNIIPVARDALVEVMTDGVFVVDLNNRVVDINLAAQEFLGLSKSSIGKNAEYLFRNTPDLVELYRNVKQGQFELYTEYYGNRYLDMRVVPLLDKRKQDSGKLFIFRDITQRKAVETQIKQANTRLQEQLFEIGKLQSELRRQAILDPLTGLYNRRYLEETLRRELLRAGRDETSVVILMLDIDHFKDFNDIHGHRAGDAVLRELGKLLRRETRNGGDIACRYGGEEFVVVLTNTSPDTAENRAEEIRKSVLEMKVSVAETELSATVSIGVASYPGDGSTGDTVLHAADNAMYRAKKAGRNCVVVHNELPDKRTGNRDTD
jgi:diguanylate cyclase (GGDEF)-like protein/PAS domain S-box-containing protein